MSEQLIGVIVGALVVLAGSALAYVFQWRIERERRREDRLWRYRRECIEGLRLTWEEICDYLFECVSVNRRFRTLVSIVWEEEEGITRRLPQPYIDEVNTMNEQLNDLIELGVTLADVLPAGVLHEPKLLEGIEKALGEGWDTVRKVRDLVPWLLEEEPPSPDKAELAAEVLLDDELRLLRSMRDVEALIKHYLTNV